MTSQEAKKVLKYHSFTHEDIDHPKMENGFLGMLRPFSGKLTEENYHEVMEAIRTLSSEIRSNEYIEKDIISAIWGICHLTRMWAIEKEGTLRSNNLINEEQISKLAQWVENISYATMMILDGSDDATAFDFVETE
ncbi:MAG: hypothetical protein AAF740_12670 [Bacteroidota bacterium]